MQSGVAESFRIRFGPQLSRTNYLAQAVNRQCVAKGNHFGTAYLGSLRDYKKMD